MSKTGLHIHLLANLMTSLPSYLVKTAGPWSSVQHMGETWPTMGTKSPSSATGTTTSGFCLRSMGKKIGEPQFLPLLSVIGAALKWSTRWRRESTSTTWPSTELFTIRRKTRILPSSPMCWSMPQTLGIQPIHLTSGLWPSRQYWYLMEPKSHMFTLFLLQD